MQSVDVAIVGGGMVGLAVACGLQGSGLRVAVLEKAEPRPLAADAPPALRVSAINAASEKLLTKLDVWREIVAQRASCYHGMEVWDKDSFGHISFDDQSMGFSHLGYIIENAVVHHALWQKAQRCADVTLLAPAELQQVAWGENEAFLSLQDGSMLTARLVIGADGANSWLRNKADIPLTFWDYHHHALVATIRTAEPHQAVARQAFHGDGILAFLPLSDPHLCSIVWSLSPGEAQRMHAQGKDIGQHLYLRRYERSRKHSAALMLAGMQGFREMFSGSHPAKKFLRDVGLKLADTLPGVKPQLIRQAMGLNDLPAWLR